VAGTVMGRVLFRFAVGHALPTRRADRKHKKSLAGFGVKL